MKPDRTARAKIQLRVVCQGELRVRLTALEIPMRSSDGGTGGVDGGYLAQAKPVFPPDLVPCALNPTTADTSSISTGSWPNTQNRTRIFGCLV